MAINFLQLHPLTRLKVILGLILNDVVLHGLAVFALAVIATATTFYHYVEGWHWLDSLYFSVVTISTVGYGDFSPHTVAGKIFTIAYIVIGLGLFATVTANLGVRLFSAVHKGFEPQDKH